MPYRCPNCRADFGNDRAALALHLADKPACNATSVKALTAALYHTGTPCRRCDRPMGPELYFSRDGLVCRNCITPEERAEAQREIAEICANDGERSGQPVATAIACAGLLAAGAIGAAILLGLKAMEVLGA